jgi:Uma2 family endonuclease
MKIIGSFEPRSHRFSVAEYYHLGELGLLSKRTELIHGIIIDMEPISPWHADIVDILNQAFSEQAPGKFRVRVQQPIDLGSESQPQPDLVLCRQGRYRDRHPSPADIFLVIEVADTTLDFDLADKRALYAGSGIAEYWIIDVQRKKLTRFVKEGVEQPVASATISPLMLPSVNIDLTELFRP